MTPAHACSFVVRARVRASLVTLSLASLIAAVAGCTEAGKSAVRVDLTTDTSVTGVDKVQLSAAGTQAAWPWTAGTMHLGLYLPSGVSGDVAVEVVGLSAAGAAIAHSAPWDAHIVVTAGQATSVVTLMLVAGPPPVTTDGGAGGSGGPGTGGGPAGTGGAGGRGTGGIAGGTGGIAGGSGGIAGGSGGSAGGTGGSAGGTGGVGAGTGGAGMGTGGGAARTWTAGKVEMDQSDFDHFPQAAMNATGKGIVAWQRGNAVWARFYDGATNAWGTARQVATYAFLGNLDVGIDGAGNGMVVWTDDTDQGVWFSRTTDGTAWPMPTRITTGMYSALPNLAVGNDGTALLAWQDSGSNPFITRAAAFKNGAWGALNNPKTAFDNGDRNPRVAIDSMGRGFLLWQQPNNSGEPNSVFYQRYDNGWMTPMLIENYNDPNYRAAAPSIAMNDAGAAMALWIQATGTQTQIWSRQFDGTNWAAAPEMVASAYSVETDSDPPAVAIDANRNAVAVWSQQNAVNPVNNVWGAQRAAGATGWAPPVQLETDNTADSTSSDYVDPVLGMDGAGNAIAMWRKKTATTVAAYTSRLPAGAASWTPTNGLLLQTSTTIPLGNIDLAVSRNGTAMAVWNSGTGEYDIWASIYR